MQESVLVFVEIRAAIWTGRFNKPIQSVFDRLTFRLVYHRYYLKIISVHFASMVGKSKNGIRKIFNKCFDIDLVYFFTHHKENHNIFK